MATIHVVPVLSDNYSYLIADDATKTAAAVDPVEPAKVLEAAGALGLTITKVLTTHNHWDHAGGNSEMAKLVPGVEIVGGQGDNASAVTKEVGHEDELQLGSTTIVCIGTPCHTPGHVSYFLPGGSIDAQIEGDAVPAPAVFTGDTLFIAGCGNFNSGTPEQVG